jgi:hypothetical protein
MPITIDKESRQRERLAIDINFMADRYKTENGIYTFTSPSLSVIDKHLFYLLRNSEERDFDRKYAMKPDYLSFDEYGTVALTWLLMYVNAVPSIEEFDLERVVIPSYSSIVEVLQDKFPIKDVEDLFEVAW